MRLEKGRARKLPRALAKRLPTSADTHRGGRNDGHDVYGLVTCSHKLRSGHLAILAADGAMQGRMQKQGPGPTLLRQRHLL